MHLMLRMSLLIGFTAGVQACNKYDKSAPIYSCNDTSADPEAGTAFCVEYTDTDTTEGLTEIVTKTKRRSNFTTATISSLESQCLAPATFAKAPCPKTPLAGSCNLGYIVNSTKITQIDYFTYPKAKVGALNQVETANNCGSAGGTYTAGI